MTALPKYIYSIDGIHQLEQRIETHGICMKDLMQWAGETAWQTLEKYWPNAQNITVFCGGGNNAGDGYILACCAKAAGKNVEVYYLKDPNALPQPARAAAEKARTANVHCVPWSDQLILTSDILVSALLGIGYQGSLKAPYDTVIRQMNQSEIPILALDVPAGLNAKTGFACDIAIQATRTITFLGLKPGLVTGDAFDHIGKLEIATWPHPLPIQAQDIQAEQLNWDNLKEILPTRKQNTYKGMYGHVLVIGGAPGFSGAIRLAGESALRCGAGLVSVATHPTHAALLNALRPELMCHGVQDAKTLQPLLDNASMILIGPGLGQDLWAQTLWQTTINTDKPILVDADALTLLAQSPCMHSNWILTPHPGEAAHLLNTTSKIIQTDRWQALFNLTKKYPGIIILKGAGTLISNGQRNFVNASSNPGMATAGMGDVLSGIVASLAAQGLPLIEASKLGVMIHSLAAEKITHTQGSRGLLASDLWQALPPLLNPKHC